jgi:ABC-type nitrate/sulfonate/bicarbonate transport system substrate-binding protein
MRYPVKSLAAIGSVVASVLAVGSSSTAQASTAQTTQTASAATYNYAPRPLKVHQTLTVSIPNLQMQNSPVALANYFHEFAKENLTVNVVVLPNPNSLTPLATGGTAIGLESWGPNIYNAISTGQKIAVVGNVFSTLKGYGVYVQSQYAACAPACLQGKTIAMGGGLSTSGVIPVQAWLGKAHLNLSDVHILNIPVISNIPIAMSQGIAQAGLLVPPFQKPLLAAGTVKLAYAVPAADPLNCFAIGPAGFSHPQAVEAFLRAIARTEKTYLRPGFLHKTKVFNAMVSVLQEPASAVAATDEPGFDPTLSLAGYAPKVTVQQRTWLSVGGLLSYSTPLPASRVIDPKFLNAALGTK